ncbi:4'-phosphopantetheinyl transferase family protein [Chloroflexota bacterium]
MKRVHQPPRPGPQEILWPFPPERFELPPDSVHVWAVDLDSLAAQAERDTGILSSAENQRGDRFRFARDRQRFITRRWALRILLGRYLNLPTTLLHFEHNPYGKPALPPELGDLSFNISHSAGLALLAFTRARQIGVDIERLRPDYDYPGVVGRFFSNNEQAALRALPPAQRRWAFFAGWTRKEAYIKAHGQGLSLPLDQFDITLTPNQPAQLLATRHDPADATRWRLQHLEPSPGYLAALAVEGRKWDLNTWQMIG